MATGQCWSDWLPPTAVWPPVAAAVVEAGTAKRAELKHYSGAMFYYGGEWYWGVDRLYHLESRLAALGGDRHPGDPLIAPRPTLDLAGRCDRGSFTLELYASLRSPYTAVIFDRAVAFAEQAGVTLNLRPVLPMVMRGVPATREKGMYIYGCRVKPGQQACPMAIFMTLLAIPRGAVCPLPLGRLSGKGAALCSAFSAMRLCWV